MKTTPYRRPHGQSKTSGSTAIIAVVVVIIVICAVLVVALLFLGGGNSPEGAFNSFVNNFNERDASGALHCTDAHFMSPAEFAEEVEDWEAEGYVSVNSVNARNPSHMTPSEIEDLEEYADEFRAEYGLTVQDYCMVDFYIVNDGDPYTDSMPCIKVGGSWYLAIMGISSDGGVQTPLGLNQQARTSNTVTILISSAPNNAMVTGTQISLIHSGSPTPITYAEVYSPAAIQMASYTYGSWTYHGGASASTLEFTAGMTIVITADSILNGDVITLSSADDYYGTTTIYVN